MNEIVDELLSVWEESCERGQPLSAERLCVDHPELLAKVKSKIKALQAMDAQFGSMLGAEPDPGLESGAITRLQQRLQVVSEYQLERLHASGGLGDVYQATEPSLKRQVAIKFPRRNRLSAEQISRFEREAQITGCLNHPGVVPVISLKHDHEQLPCYVMRFVDGPTLRQRVEQLRLKWPNPTAYRASREFRQLLQSFVTVCNIAAYAHGQGIIHRDIKPENIILGPFGETLLMDWGLAKVMNEPDIIVTSMSGTSGSDTVTERGLQTIEGQVMGTPAYASPEQLQGRVDLTDFRSDVYSLGATLYFLVAGATKRNHEAGEAGVSIHRGLIPERLAAICRKAMAERIEDRYPSAAKLREEVECYLADEPISVVAESVWSRFVRGVRRRPTFAAAVLVGVLITVIAGAVSSIILSQKNRELTLINEKLTSAKEQASISEKRSKSTNELLNNALFAATPEQTLGQARTIRDFLETIAQQLGESDSVDVVVAGDTHKILTEAYLSLGDLESAQRHAELSYKAYVEGFGEDSAEAITGQAHLALILSHRDEDTQALALAKNAWERALQIESLDADSVITVTDIFANVTSQAPNPDHTQIVALHREAYEISLEAFGELHRNTLNMQSNLATSLMDAGDLANAEIALKEIHQAHSVVQGPKHPETLVDVFNLIALNFNQGKFESANKLCLEHIAIYDEVFTPTHRRSIRLRILLARTWNALKKWDEAANVAADALERSAAHMGPVHQLTFEARGVYGTALIGSGKLDEARALADEQYQKALESVGPGHPYTTQAALLQFDLAEARGDFEGMSKWFEQIQGTDLEAEAAPRMDSARNSPSVNQKSGS
ncbi:MAG: serine/threonine protein kinase [Planctomycetaceae bacterium]|nr:serine/threonine protein kinase [Planctomycetaceae bacterium]